MLEAPRTPLTDAERLEEILRLLEDLRALAADHVLIVEGKKDCAALEVLSIQGDMYQMQTGGGAVGAVEYVEAHGGKAVILTDWDRKGEELAARLEELLGQGNPSVDTRIRRELRRLCRMYIKDTESLDTLVRNLSAKSI